MLHIACKVGSSDVKYRRVVDWNKYLNTLKRQVVILGIKMKTRKKLDRVMGSKNWRIEEDHSTGSAYFPVSYFTLKGPLQIASGQPVYLD